MSVSLRRRNRLRGNGHAKGHQLAIIKYLMYQQHDISQTSYVSISAVGDAAFGLRLRAITDVTRLGPVIGNVPTMTGYRSPPRSRSALPSSNGGRLHRGDAGIGRARAPASRGAGRRVPAGCWRLKVGRVDL
jgi:hypothetical protein